MQENRQTEDTSVNENIFPQYIWINKASLEGLKEKRSTVGFISIEMSETCKIPFRLRPAFPNIQETELYEFGKSLMKRLDIDMSDGARNEILFQTINQHLRNDRTMAGIGEKSHPINSDAVSVRLWNVCRAYGWAYWSEVIEIGEAKLKKFRRVGVKAVKEMKIHIEKIGLEMKP